jgi:ABC-type sugar transport system, periplasmic component
MKIIKKLTTLIIIMLITLIIIGVTPNNTFASEGMYSNNGNIVNAAVLLYSYDDLFMLKLKESLEEIERENKEKIRFTFYDGKNNIAVQNETIDSILRNGSADIIIANLADISENYVENVVLAVKSKNIPIILVNVDPQVVTKISAIYNKAVFIIEPPDVTGEIQGKILIDLWKSDKKKLDKNNDDILQYILLKGEVDNPVAINRSKEVISTLNKAGIQTQQLALINADWLKELAKNSIENLFLKYDGKIEAIISNNDAMAIGAIEALQKYGYNAGDKTKNIAVIGSDGIPEAKALIDKGIMTGTVIQDPKILAKLIYNVGGNLANNLNPIENTDYQMANGIIIVPFKYQPYTVNTNMS